MSQLPGMVAAERIEAVRMRVNGTDTAVVGVDPSQFRSFAAQPTGAANALWQGVADGGIAVSYTMGKLDKIPLGGSVLAAGRTTKRLPVVAFGTLGIGGVNAVVSDATARRLARRPATRSWSACRPRTSPPTSAAIGRLLPKGAGVEQLVSLVSSGRQARAGRRGSGHRARGARHGARHDAQRGDEPPGAAVRLGRRRGRTSFDCSGLVQWSFAQAGIVMPRVAADQALSGPAVPVSQLAAG